MNDYYRTSHPDVLNHYYENTERNLNSTTDEVIYMNLRHPEIRIADERKSQVSIESSDADSGYESIEVFGTKIFAEDEQELK